MPRISDLDHLRRVLKRSILGLGTAEDSRPEEEPPSSESENDIASDDTIRSGDDKYPLLKQFGIATDLLVKENDNLLMDLVGECFLCKHLTTK